MELQSKADWFALIGAVETGSPQPSAVTRAVAILQGGMEELHTVLASASDAVEHWPAMRDDMAKTLGEIMLLEERVKGRRSKEATQIRQRLKATKARTLANFEKAETANYALTEGVVASLSLQGLALDTIAQLDTADWSTAAERMRQYWDTVDAMTKRMMRLTGA